MTIKEYDKEVNRRLRRRAWRKYGWIVKNPITYLMTAIALLAALGLEVA